MQCIYKWSLLITYEKAFLVQAAAKKFFAATFLERKIMSTKTSFKRIALVAASALALGGFSVISAPQANAAPQIVAAASGMYDTTNFYQVVGGQATIEIGFDTTVVSTVSSTGVGTIVSATPKTGAGLGFETLTAVTSTGFQHNILDGGALDQEYRRRRSPSVLRVGGRPPSPSVPRDGARAFKGHRGATRGPPGMPHTRSPQNGIQHPRRRRLLGPFHNRRHGRFNSPELAGGCP